MADETNGKNFFETIYNSTAAFMPPPYTAMGTAIQGAALNVPMTTLADSLAKGDQAITSVKPNPFKNSQGAFNVAGLERVEIPGLSTETPEVVTPTTAESLAAGEATLKSVKTSPFKETPGRLNIAGLERVEIPGLGTAAPEVVKNPTTAESLAAGEATLKSVKTSPFKETPGRLNVAGLERVEIPGLGTKTPAVAQAPITPAASLIPASAIEGLPGAPPELQTQAVAAQKSAAATQSEFFKLQSELMGAYTDGTKREKMKTAVSGMDGKEGFDVGDLNTLQGMKINPESLAKLREAVKSMNAAGVTDAQPAAQGETTARSTGAGNLNNKNVQLGL